MNDADTMQFVIDEICHVDPSYRPDIRGVDEAVISRLETLSGRPLPTIHRDFLSQMGEDWGIPMPKADFRAARLIAYFEKIAWRPPLSYTLIGLDNFGTGEDYFLAERTSPPSVVLFPKGSDPTEPGADLSYCDFEAPSLPDFVFNLFFFLRHLKRSPNYIDASKIQDLEGAFTKTIETLDRLGLPRHPRSGASYVYYVTPEVSVAVGQPEGYGLGVDLGGNDRNRVEQVFAVLHDHVGLHRHETL